MGLLLQKYDNLGNYLNLFTVLRHTMINANNATGLPTEQIEKPRSKKRQPHL